ncbi:hypothetical protein WG899_20710 [Paucibacter sp. AS339]|uniref:hypothetical protein n=1 Tax=Paucibacter hankyongi TaxID=3133434 RepID=UPI0030A5F5E6
MNSSTDSASVLLRWRRRVAARLARPQALFLSPEGVQAYGDKPQAFADWCRAHAGQAAELSVSAKLLHELVCEAGLPLADEAQLQAYARQLFGHYFGAPAKSWPLATWRVASPGVGSGPATEQCGAVALHGPAGAQLQACAAMHEVHLSRVQPAWAPLLRRLVAEQPEWAQTPSAALAWVEGQVLTWLQLRDGRLQGLRQLRLAAATQAALGETLAELCGAGGAGAIKSVLVCGYGLEPATSAPSWPGLRVLGRLDGSAPEPGCFEERKPDAKSGLPRPDFLGLRLPRSPLAWPLAGLGGLALLAGLWCAVGSQQGLRQAQARQQALSAEAAQELGKPAAAKVSLAPARQAARGSANSAESDALRSATEVQALLLHPWQAVLANVEQAGAGAGNEGGADAGAASLALNWLALDYNAGRQELRLEGLAADKLPALQMVDRLSAAPGWQAVMLSRFQNGEQGLVGQRFEVSAKLRPAALRLELPPMPAAEVAKP